MKTKANLLTVLLFCGILAVFSGLFWILPDKDFSAEENRSLRSLPRWSWEDFLSGDLSESVNAYYEDQFPLRDGFVGVKAVSELLLGKGENDGILLGNDGQVARRMFSVRYPDGSVSDTELDGFSATVVQNAIAGIERLRANTDLPLCVVLPGRSIDVAASAFDYPADGSEKLLALLAEETAESDWYCDVNGILQSAYEGGEYVTYKTDHHWTTRGAYLAYLAMMDFMGASERALQPTYLTVEVASETFRGTSYSAGGMKFLPSDTIEFWHYDGEDSYTVVADGTPLEGFYSRSYLAKKDGYGAFLDGTHDVVTVFGADENRPTLLVAKDSFANCLLPFLADSFNLVILNLSSTRTDFTNLSELAVTYSADAVLVLCNLENLLTSDRLERLR